MCIHFILKFLKKFQKNGIALLPWSHKCGSPASTLEPCGIYRRALENILTRIFLLASQGSMFNSWKPMWVVLLEDGIEFYKKKSDNSPKGMIPLKGSALTSPCQDFGKRMVS